MYRYYYVPIYIGKKNEEFEFYRQIYKNITFFSILNKPSNNYEEILQNIFKEIKDSQIHTIYLFPIQEIDNEEDFKKFMDEFEKIKNAIEFYENKNITYEIRNLPFLKINFDLKDQLENCFIFKSFKRNGIKYEDIEWFKELFEYFHLLSLNEKDKKCDLRNIIPLKGTFAIKRIEFEKFTLIKKNLFDYFKKWIQRKEKIPEFNEKDLEEFQNILLKEINFPYNDFKEVRETIENNIKDKNLIIKKIKEFKKQVNENYIQKYIKEIENKYNEFFKRWIIEKLKNHSFEEIISFLKEMGEKLRKYELPEIEIIKDMEEIFDEYEEKIEAKWEEISGLKIWEKNLFFGLFLIIFGVLNYFIKLFIKNFFFTSFIPIILSLVLSYFLKEFFIGSQIKSMRKEIKKLYEEMKNKLKEKFIEKAKEKFKREIKIYYFKNCFPNFVEKEIEYMESVKQKLNEALESINQKQIDNLDYEIKEKIEKINWLDMVKMEEIYKMDKKFLKRKIELLIFEKARELFKEEPDYEINLNFVNEDIIKKELTSYDEKGNFIFIVLTHPKAPQLNFNTLATFYDENIMGINIYVIHKFS
jgi:hypothetical protein